MKPTEQEIKDAALEYSERIEVLYNGFTKGANWAISQMQPEWISVEDRLPEESGQVLGCMKDTFDIYVCHYKPSRKLFLVYGAGVDPISDMKVTHWMPLPHPPFTQCEMYGHSLQPVVGFDNEITDYQCLGCGMLESSIPKPPTK